MIPYQIRSCWLVEKHGRQSAGLFCLVWLKWKLKKSSPLEVSGRFSKFFIEMFLGWQTLYQIPSSSIDCMNTMASRGWDYFAIYDYRENLKNLLLRKCQADYQILFLEMFPGWLSIRFHQAMLIFQKTCPPGGEAVWRFNIFFMAM